LNSLVSLDISKCRHLTDSAVQHLSSMDQLKVLNLSSLKVTDACGHHLPRNIINLDLSGTAITQTILSYFSSSLRSNIEYLSFAHTKFSNVNNKIIKIEEMTKLRKLNLDGNKVCYDGSIIKLRDFINKVKNNPENRIAEIRNGSLEIKSNILNSSYDATLNQKLLWQQTVFPYFSQYLNQSLAWPKVSAKKKKVETPNTKKRRLDILMKDKENFHSEFDLVFPKSKESMQSIHMENSLKSGNESVSKPNYGNLIADYGRGTRSGLGDQCPIPVELETMLDLKKTSPESQRTKKIKFS